MLREHFGKPGAGAGLRWLLSALPSPHPTQSRCVPLPNLSNSTKRFKPLNFGIQRSFSWSSSSSLGGNDKGSSSHTQAVREKGSILGAVLLVFTQICEASALFRFYLGASNWRGINLGLSLQSEELAIRGLVEKPRDLCVCVCERCSLTFWGAPSFPLPLSCFKTMHFPQNHSPKPKQNKRAVFCQSLKNTNPAARLKNPSINENVKSEGKRKIFRKTEEKLKTTPSGKRILIKNNIPVDNLCFYLKI